jgi:hypothetical protein
MSNSYTLVNPFIHGDFKSTIKSKNSVNAAKSFYKNLSEHFNNNIPKFYFTIQKGGSGNGKYYHFLVKESKGANDEVKFKVESYNVSNEEANLKVFKNKLVKFKSKFEQAGGKKAKKGSKKGSKAKKSIDDDSDLDSSEDFYRRAQTYKPVVTPPLYYWWYDPGVYGLDSVFVPTFYSYVTPYIQYSLGGYIF